MTKPKKQKGILLLDKNKLDVFVDSMSAIASFPFQPTVIRNIELIDKVLLQSQLRTFLQTNKILPADFTLILHENILFEKVFPSQVKTPAKPVAPVPPPVKAPAQPAPSGQPPAQTTSTKPPQPQLMQQPGGSTALAPTALNRQQFEDEQEKAIQHFIDSIPFEEVLVKRTKVAEGTLVLGTNKALIVALKELLVAEGFEIEMVYPAMVLPKEANPVNGLTPELAHLLLAKVDTMKAQNMLIDEPRQQVGSPLATPLALPQKESERRRLILLGGVFGLLIVVMVVLFLRMNAENAKFQKPQRSETAARRVTPIITQPVAPPTAVPKDAVSIQITRNTVNTAEAQQIERNLRTSGFPNVAIRQGTVSSSETLIIFSGNIPEDTRSLITDSVASVSAQFAIQESSVSAEPTVVITL